MTSFAPPAAAGTTKVIGRVGQSCATLGTGTTALSANPIAIAPIAKVGLQGYVAEAGANGVLMLYPQEIRNYRDWTAVDIDLWRHYWFAMVNRGVMAQPYWWDEQWTISVQHTEADINKHLSAFEDIAPALAKAQQERAAALAVQ